MIKNTQSNFQKILLERVSEICIQEDLSIEINENKGYAFSLFVSELFMEWDTGIDQAYPNEVTSRGGNDKRADCGASEYFSVNDEMRLASGQSEAGQRTGRTGRIAIFRAVSLRPVEVARTVHGDNAD